jgi:RND superfamily putative drug exporter
VLGTWLAIVLLAAAGARQLPVVARGGSGVLDQSAAQRADSELNREFADPWVNPLALAIAGDPDDSSVQAAVLCSQTALAARPDVRAVASLAETDPAFQATHAAGLVIALRNPDLDAQEHAVPVLRAALDPCRIEFLAAAPGGRYALTGRAAYTVDLNAWNKRSGDRAEIRALPLTLLILVLVFGRLLAAAVPVLMGMATTTAALALAWVLARVMPISNLTGNVITMLGLALGIDYSLLMVSRFRELADDLPRRDAIARLLGSAGPMIVWSGIIVSVALLGLLWSPLLETRCIGVGGALVAMLSVLAALTLLPACIALLGKHIRWRGSRSVRVDRHGLYEQVGKFITRRPLLTLLVTATVIAVVALPGSGARIGYSTDANFFPPQMEARVGAEILNAARHGNDGLAIDLLVHAGDGTAILSQQHLASLYAFGQTLASEPRVATVLSPVNLAPGVSLSDYRALYADPKTAFAQYPVIGDRLVSRRGDVALFHVTPESGLPLASVQRLAADLANKAPRGPYWIEAGGAPSYFNDFDRSLTRSMPRVFAFIVVVTMALLFLAFRSWLIPIKAALLNLMTVAAGFGVVVAVCQWGWGARLIGLEAPLGVIPPTVPLMIFCLSFGVSMDYELFLLFRISGEYATHGDATRATVTGLSRAAPIVTGAALIMAVVFASFVASDVALVKMLGVGLAAAVIIDATVMRTFLLPAAMTLAGRWNWHPGRSASNSSAVPPGGLRRPAP